MTLKAIIVPEQLADEIETAARDWAEALDEPLTPHLHAVVTRAIIARGARSVIFDAERRLAARRTKR